MIIDLIHESLEEFKRIFNEDIILSISKRYNIKKDFKNNEYPSSTKPGVYLFFSKKMELLYIGSSNTLGIRLSSYFKFDISGNTSQAKKDEYKNYEWLITIALIDKFWFLASSLELFLIDKLRPKNNKINKG